MTKNNNNNNVETHKGRTQYIPETTATTRTTKTRGRTTQHQTHLKTNIVKQSQIANEQNKSNDMLKTLKLNNHTQHKTKTRSNKTFTILFFTYATNYNTTTQNNTTVYIYTYNNTTITTQSSTLLKHKTKKVKPYKQ